MAGAAGLLAVPARPAGVKPLRITRVRTVEVRDVITGKGLVLPWDPKKIPQDTRDYVVTQFETSQGLTGISMDGDYKLPAGTGAEVQKHAEEYFIGRDPFDIGIHDTEFFNKRKSRARLSFLEVALWDIIGKAVGQPLYRLWGAAGTKVKPYAATVHFNKTPQERAEDALKFYELGFRAIKLRLHHEGVKDDLALARTVMDAVRGKMDVMVDANQGDSRPGSPPPVWDRARAIRVARELDEMGLYWLEEPLNRSSLDDMAAVRASVKRLRIAGGEGTMSLPGFSHIFAKGALSYIQPDPMYLPASSVRKVAGMAEAFGIPFGPHHGKSGVGMIANLHMQCAAPNTGFLEYMYDPGFWNAEGFQAGFAAVYPVDKSGYIHAPEKPGLGIDWDRAFFRKHGLVWG